MQREIPKRWISTTSSQLMIFYEVSVEKNNVILYHPEKLLADNNIFRDAND